MISHVIIGVDGEVYAVLNGDTAVDMGAAYSAFQRAVDRLREIDGLSRSDALDRVGEGSFGKELDPDAEAFVSYLIGTFDLTAVVDIETFSFGQ